MKKFHFILLLAIFACSPDNDEAIVEQQSTSSDTPESMNLESGPALNRDSGNLIYKETFENPELYNNPQAGDFYLEHAENHSFSIEENIVKEGSQAGRFEIKKSDSKIWGGHRTEMSQAQNTARAEGWYGFSQYFPASYTSGSTGEVIGQWHDQADDGEHVDRSPSNTLLTVDGRIKWMARWDADKIMDSGYSDGLEYIDLGAIPNNEWIDWVVHIKYSHTNTGILEVWMNGEKVIDRQNMPNSYNDDAYPYFKFGVYKWNWGSDSSQKVIYYDEVRIGTENSSYDEVKPRGSEEVAPPESKINMMVNSYTVSCVGEMEGTCLLVQEGDMIGTDNWENFYFSNSIEGFSYEPGFVYGLEVKKTELENPPLGGSSIKYELVEIVSKEAQ